MIRLLVLRHAHSVSRDECPTDFERTLSAAGLEAARELGEQIGRAGLRVDVIASSPALRALQTARTVAEAAGLSAEIRAEEALYEADAERCLEILASEPAVASCVLLVGHNPAMERLASMLTGRPVALGTCALAELELDAERWSEVSRGTRGTLRGTMGGKR